jgi:hypothetical protein
MRKSVTKDIDGITFTIQQLGAKDGRRVLTRITKVVGSGFAGDSFAAAVQALTDADVDFLCDTFAANTTYSEDGGQHTYELAKLFDEIFADKYGTMLRWLWACLEVSFGSFLGELGITPGVVSELKTKAMAAMAAPSAPISSSGSPS